MTAFNFGNLFKSGSSFGVVFFRWIGSVFLLCMYFDSRWGVVAASCYLTSALLKIVNYHFSWNDVEG